MNKLFASLILCSSMYNLNAQDLYDIENITTIELNFSDLNWDQTMDTYYSNGNDERLIAETCYVNGVLYDSVGVKYKGNSTYSASNSKNPLNIKLDYIKDNQDYDGFYTLKLSNGKKDPSFVREVLSYEIARKYMDAPLSNYAKVYINGNYHGLYSSSEAINKKFVEEKFYSDEDNTLVKCNPVSVMNGGSSLEYLGTDSTSYYDYYEMSSDYGWADLPIYTNELNNNFANIENSWDIDRAIWMLAFSNVVVSLDTYIGPFKQNYYLFKDDHGRFLPIVWDMNESLGGFEMINTGGGPGGGGPGGGNSNQDLQELDPLLRLGESNYPLANNILGNTRYQKMYMAHFRTILEENFTTGWYNAKSDSLQTLIFSDVSSDPNAYYTTSDMTTNLDNTNDNTIGITELMESRITFLQSNSEYLKVGPTISNIVSPALASINSTINITADINNGTYAYLGYRDNISDIFTKVEMFDDGAHNDGSAGDGTYGVSIPAGASTIQYYIYSDNNDAGMFSPQRAEHEYHEIAVAGDIVINELSASNSNIEADQDGEYDDWIELYNNTSSSIDLSGYYLTDDASDLTQYQIPSGTSIPANGYLIIWADNDVTQTGLHASFKLSSSGETLILLDPSQNILDEVTFGGQVTNVTYGRYTNGTGTFQFMNPTYNAQNTNVLTTEIIEVFENEIKIYPNPAITNLTVELNDNKNNDLIIYSLEGKEVYSNTINGYMDINVANFLTGVYLIKIDNQIKKFIKK